MTKESPMKRIIRWIKGDASAETEATRQECREIAARIKAHRAKKRAKVGAAAVTAVVLAGLLPSCAALGKWVPRAQFSLGAFGVTLAVDTRTLTDAVGDVAVSVSDLVLPQPPAANAGLPVPVPEVAK